MDDVLVERVLRAVELVPRGRVVSYGDLAALVGTGPRQVAVVRPPLEPEIHHVVLRSFVP